MTFGAYANARDKGISRVGTMPRAVLSVKAFQSSWGAISVRYQRKVRNSLLVSNSPDFLINESDDRNRSKNSP